MLLEHDLGVFTVLLHVNLEGIWQHSLDIGMPFLLGPVGSRVAILVANLRIDS